MIERRRRTGSPRPADTHTDGQTGTEHETLEKRIERESTINEPNEQGDSIVDQVLKGIVLGDNQVG